MCVCVCVFSGSLVWGVFQCNKWLCCVNLGVLFEAPYFLGVGFPENRKEDHHVEMGAP